MGSSHLSRLGRRTETPSRSMLTVSSRHRDGPLVIDGAGDSVTLGQG